MEPSRWEHGSDFPLTAETGSLDAPWNGRPATLWGSGRDALRALLRFGRGELGFRRILVPSFVCREVVAALARDIEVARYDDAPDDPPPLRVAARRGDVLLLVNTWGGRKAARIETDAVVVEDHTHDPLSEWAFASAADYAVASLRKTLPLPDGGVLWSPAGRALPAERSPTDRHARTAMERLLAMALKRDYLEGGAVDKAEFRALAAATEAAMGTGEVSGISATSRSRLPTLPSRRWRERRARNLETFRAAFGLLPGVRLLEAPFAATLQFESATARERVRRALIEASVYPAVLWPLEEDACVPPAHIELSRRVLSLHCDYRYDAADMQRVASAVRAVFAAEPEPAAAQRR
jgi:hypothetical protein